MEEPTNTVEGYRHTASGSMGREGPKALLSSCTICPRYDSCTNSSARRGVRQRNSRISRRIQLTHTRSDDEREAASLAITDTLETSTGELLNNDFHRVASTANDLLANHGIADVKRDSLDWKRLCRGLLVGLQTALQTELRHVEGDFAPHPTATAVLQRTTAHQSR